jgi:putative hydrolase of the HAD superfamily
MPLPRPEAIFFDVGDTLIRAHPSWAAVYREGLAEHGIELAEKDLERALLEETKVGAWWNIEDPFDATEENSYERIKAFDLAVLSRLGLTDVDDDAIRAIESGFARISSWHVFPDVNPALDAIQAAGIRMGVISNFVWGGVELIHDLELARHFDSLTVSARVGFQKPHQGIFQHALDALRVQPENAWHVGDSYRADVFGARRMGITPVLITRYGDDPARVKEEHDDADLTVIRDLNELLDELSIARPMNSAEPAPATA